MDRSLEYVSLSLSGEVVDFLDKQFVRRCGVKLDQSPLEAVCATYPVEFLPFYF
jgi:hypothetical protein